MAAGHLALDMLASSFQNKNAGYLLLYCNMAIAKQTHFLAGA